MKERILRGLFFFAPTLIIKICLTCGLSLLATLLSVPEHLQLGREQVATSQAGAGSQEAEDKEEDKEALLAGEDRRKRTRRTETTLVMAELREAVWRENEGGLPQSGIYKPGLTLQS